MPRPPAYLIRLSLAFIQHREHLRPPYDAFSTILFRFILLTAHTADEAIDGLFRDSVEARYLMRHDR